MFTSELFAAQLFFLRRPTKVNIAEVLAIVFQDLVLRRVLNLIKTNTFPTDRSKKKQKYFMFVKGENFEGYEPTNFEKQIIAPFEDHDQLQAKVLTNSILRKYGLPSGYISDEILAPLKKEKLISAIPVLSAFGMKKAAGSGKETVDELNAYLVEKEQELTAAVDNDREKFIQVMKEMKTLIFFLKKDNPELFASIIENVKWVNQNKPLGIENDLFEFTEAINVDMSHLEAH